MRKVIEQATLFVVFLALGAALFWFAVSHEDARAALKETCALVPAPERRACQGSRPTPGAAGCHPRLLEGGPAAEGGDEVKTFLWLLTVFASIGLMIWLLPPREIEERLKS